MIAQKQGCFSDEGLEVTYKSYSFGKKAMEAGAINYMVKPLDLKKLTDMPGMLIIKNGYENYSAAIINSIQDVESLTSDNSSNDQLLVCKVANSPRRG